MFISFSLHICEVLAEKLPDFTVQFLGSSKSPDQLAKKGIKGVDYTHGVFALHKKWYKQARKNGMSVNAWTVNEEEHIRKMLRMGVGQITTDNPLEAREIMQNSGITELH